MTLRYSTGTYAHPCKVFCSFSIVFHSLKVFFLFFCRLLFYVQVSCNPEPFSSPQPFETVFTFFFKRNLALKVGPLVTGLSDHRVDFL